MRSATGTPREVRCKLSAEGQAMAKPYEVSYKKREYHGAIERGRSYAHL